MENAKHIGGIWALAVALGVGMAVANTPAVALAAPGDSGKGPSSGDSSPSRPSRHSGSTSSDAPSAQRALSPTNDPANRYRRPQNPSGAVHRSGSPHTGTTTGSSASAATTALTPSSSTSLTEETAMPATLDALGTVARRSGRATSRPPSGNTSMRSSPNPLAVHAPAADPTVRDSSLHFTRLVATGVSSFASTTPSAAATPAAALTAAPVPSTAAPPAMAPPTPVVPVSRVVSTLIHAVLSPFANSAPTAPVQSPAAWTLLACARREFERARTPSTIVNPPPRPITNGLVTDTVGVTSAVASPAVDPGFISSTHNFGLFSITSAADPDDNHFVAFVFQTPIFTIVLTSGADPEDNLGFGAASTGVAGHTVGTFISPVLNFSIGIPIEDPFAELFTEFVRLGF
jgi:hypothetical protein